MTKQTKTDGKTSWNNYFGSSGVRKGERSTETLLGFTKNGSAVIKETSLYSGIRYFVQKTPASLGKTVVDPSKHVYRGDLQ